MAATSTGTPSDQELASNPSNHFKTLAVALCNPDAKEEVRHSIAYPYKHLHFLVYSTNTENQWEVIPISSLYPSLSQQREKLYNNIYSCVVLHQRQ